MAEEPTTPDVEELSHRLADAMSRRDFDAAAAMYAPDAVWSTSGFEGLFEGREAIRGLLEDWIAPYEDFEVVFDEFRDLGNGAGFSVTLQRGKPKGSTVFVELRMAAVSVWADELIERFATYPDIDEARAAAERLAQERG